MSNSPFARPSIPSFFSRRGGGSAHHRVTQIGRYRLDSLIAVGGMGSIHFGVLSGAAEFSRLVAIKRLHPQLAEDPQFRVRFVEEARLNARVLHPNVVQLLDVVEADDELWLIMEYVDGETLHGLQTAISAAARLLPLDVVAGVIGGVLEGLNAAHETRDASGAPLRIVHRDVSPQNIMISRCGHVKVIDFGIAKATTPTAVSTLGRLVGKVSYMSPEQARGTALDQRSDVFSAGVVLWEALTGQRLFRGAKQSHAAALRDVLRKPVPAPSTYRTEIPSALDSVVLRALDRNPSDRFSSAREFAQALDAVVPLASSSRIGAYLTVFCEARTVSGAGTNGPLRVTAPSPQTAVTRVLADHEEPTSLALTGISEPVRLVAPRKSWRGRIGPYALPLGFVLCSIPAARWAMRGQNPAAERSIEAVASPARAHTGALRQPVVGVEAASPRPQHESAFGRQTLTSQPEATTAALEVPPVMALREIAKQRTWPPRLASPPPTSKRAAPTSKQAAPTSKQAASTEPLPSEHDDCSAPTYLGKDGIQHFKGQCL
jgi:serine/threonine-protein kinase